eukprot:gene10316-11387_t
MELVEDNVLSSQTMDNAAERFCESKVQATQPSFKNIYDILHSLEKSISVHDNTITVDREEIWRGALGFYNKALMYKTRLLKELCLIFESENGLDAGAVKTEFFEMLLKEVHMRLFEGTDGAKFLGTLKIAIKKYVTQGLQRNEALDFLKRDVAQYPWSMRSLDQCMTHFETHCNDSGADYEEVEKAVKEELAGRGKLWGYMALHKEIRRKCDILVTRDRVYDMMYNIDPSGLVARGVVGRKKSAKKKGNSTSLGTN